MVGSLLLDDVLMSLALLLVLHALLIGLQEAQEFILEGLVSRVSHGLGNLEEGCCVESFGKPAQLSSTGHHWGSFGLAHGRVWVPKQPKKGQSLLLGWRLHGVDLVVLERGLAHGEFMGRDNPGLACRKENVSAGRDVG